MLEKLVSSLYSALDKSPDAKIAIRVQHPDGVRWEVAKRNLSVWTEGGASIGSVALDSLTIGQLAGWLRSQGCSVVYENPDFSAKSASVLLNGSGMQSISNGDALEAYDSILWSLLDAYAFELEGASDSIDQALLQMYLGTVDGEWLDYWGEHFGMPREGRSDNDYREYIVEETLRNRDNALAIEKTIRQLAGEAVSIREPWKDIFILGESRMDDRHHFHGAHYYTYGVIQPVANTGTNWNKVLPLINRNKAGGVVIADPQNLVPPATVDAAIPTDSPKSAKQFVRTAKVRLAMDPPLDVYQLSSDPYILNHPLVVYTLAALSSPGLSYVADIPKPRTVAKAAVCLSEDMALGDPNVILGRGRTDRFMPGMVLSGAYGETGLKLSDDKSYETHLRVDEVIDQRNMADLRVNPQAQAGMATFLYQNLFGGTSNQSALDIMVLSETQHTLNHEGIQLPLRTAFVRYQDWVVGRAWVGAWDNEVWVAKVDEFKITHIHA